MEIKVRASNKYYLLSQEGVFGVKKRVLSTERKRGKAQQNNISATQKINTFKNNLIKFSYTNNRKKAKFHFAFSHSDKGLVQ